ncbi:glycosyltransferase family 2 protein [Flavobacterium sp. FlaQc-28]|uniref:glycosyltransferase family 2 protein n=1 Tax=Flavobacterium sp. FlaQc-28 TaxID=3374178 RepID=UPI003756BC4E
MLAIIIPFYKSAYFEETIQSLINQSDKRFRVYIGDDASPECPKKIIEKYQDKFDVNYYRFNENLGSKSLTKQWRRCIDLSGNEEWIMILGDDDVLSNNTVAQFYKSLPQIDEEINVIRYSTQLINERNETISDVYTHPEIEKSADFLIRKITNRTRSSLSEYIFKKEKVFEIGFRDYPLAWYSDDMAVLEFSEFKNVYCINKAVIFVRFSSLSISGDVTKERIKNKAKFAFYYFLLTRRTNCFSKKQKQILVSKISNCYINEKKQIVYFLKISWLYFNYNSFINYLKFIKSVACHFTKIVKKYMKVIKCALFIF